jgi:glycerol-3-phosphate dehydrogenase
LKRNISSLENEKFDLIVIGGGIIGTGIARDAALRGIKTLLVEKDDFGCGTTSRSSRLIHGGLRYLRMMQFHLVRQDLHEREVLLRIASHLVHPYPFIMPMTAPIYTIALRLGVPLYDLLSYDKSIPSRHYLSKREAVQMEPCLGEIKNLYGAYMYYDCQAPYTERLGIENVLSASEHRAEIINHTEVTGFLREGSNVSGVEIKDLIGGGTYRVKAKLVINAAGQWVDCVRDLLKGGASIIRRTKGVHLVTKSVSNRALVLLSPIDNRLFFVMPWLGYSLIGTTDTNYTGDIEAPAAEPEDVTYTLAGVRQVFPHLTVKDIFYTTAGLRPLAHIGGEKPSQVSREHKILDHKQRDNIGGLISVLGGKITAYRAVAQDAVDLACFYIGIKGKCTTAETPLPGAPAVSRQQIEEASRESKLDAEVVAHLAELYGSRFKGVIKFAQKSSLGTRPICPHCKDILSQVQHAIEEESALTVSDFLLRRSLSGLAECQGLDAVDTVAEEMGRILGWSKDEQSRQVAIYKAQAELAQSFRFEA